MRLIRAAFLLVPAVFAQDPPPCRKQFLGTFFPREANVDRAVRRQAVQDGSLKICTGGPLRYRWRSLAVTFQQLVREAALTQPPEPELQEPQLSRPASEPTGERKERIPSEVDAPPAEQR